jgi:hypothetical protein
LLASTQFACAGAQEVGLAINAYPSAVRFSTPWQPIPPAVDGVLSSLFSWLFVWWHARLSDFSRSEPSLGLPEPALMGQALGERTRKPVLGLLLTSDICKCHFRHGSTMEIGMLFCGSCHLQCFTFACSFAALSLGVAALFLLATKAERPC